MLDERPAEMPFATMRALRAGAQVDHLGAGVGLLATVGDGDGVELALDESSPRRMQEGYFQVMALPVSTCVQLTLERAPRQSARLVTKL